MAKVILDFSKAPPVSKSSKFDRIPEGPYTMKIEATLTESQGDDPHPMVNFSLTVKDGKQKGKCVSDSFWIGIRKKDSPFGLQRLHGAMIAAGIKEQAGTVAAKAVVEKLNGREVVAVVRDNEMEARGDFPARTVSRPNEYIRVGTKEAKAVLAGGSADTDDDDADADEDEDEPKKKSSDDDDDDGDDDDDDDDKPAKKKGKKVEEEEEEDDDDEPPAKKKKKAKDDDDDDDDDDEEEEKPKKSKGKKKADEFDDPDDDD